MAKEKIVTLENLTLYNDMLQDKITAINKKLIHFKNFENFNSKKLSANESNTQYTLGVDGAVQTGAPEILYQSICWIKDEQKMWTHGTLYSCNENHFKTVNGESILGEGNITNYTPITYSELKVLRDNSQLIPGMFYRITDYVTTTAQENTQSAGHQFDILVLATSSNTLSHNALAEKSEQVNTPSGWVVQTLESDSVSDTRTFTLSDKLINNYGTNVLLSVIANDLSSGYLLKRTGTMSWENSEGVVYTSTVQNPEAGSTVTDAGGVEYMVAYSERPWYVFESSETNSGSFVKTLVHDELPTTTPVDSEFLEGTTGVYFKLAETAEGMYVPTVLLGMSHIEIKVSEVLYNNYFANANLAAWKLWYDIDNDTTKYAWADEVNGKGVIYRMIDEHGNDCPYDFKNIQFKRKLTDGALDTENGIVMWCYTFNAYCGDDTNIYDATVIARREIIDDDDANRCHENIIKEVYGSANNEGLILNDIVFLNIYSIESPTYFHCHSNSFGNDCQQNTFGNACVSNSFGNNCYSNIFGDYCWGNSFGNYCWDNSFGNECSYNLFGNNCYRNTFGNACVSNSFENNCYRNTFGNDCCSNSFGNDCYENSFEYDSSSNSFGNRCNRNSSINGGFISNSFGNYCNDNSFRGDCAGNSFGNYCQDNTFNSLCCSNSFENNCQYNFFGNDCSYNSFGNDCQFNSFRVSANTSSALKSYVQYNHFDDGCSYNVIWNSNTTSSTVPLKNININRGVYGKSTGISYNYINIKTLNSEKEINVNNYNGHTYIDYGDIFNVTYNKLVELRDNSQLIPGRQYRIIDYVTTTSQENTRSAGHPFDIIVTALDKNTLSEEAQAAQNISDGYFDDINLSAWRLWYSLDNDTNRFVWAGDEITTSKEVEVSTYDSSECIINSELIDGNAFITPFNFESCVWVDGDGEQNDYEGDSNHDEAELVYEWGYFTDENDNTHLCLYKSDADLYQEEGQPDYGDKYLYRGVVNVDGTDYDYWQKWDENNGSINVGGTGDYVYATTVRIVSNPEACSVETTNETIETVIQLNPKGVIYRMIDEFGNDCPYDFKNIQFKHPNDTTAYPDYYYTFSTVIDGVVTDHSMLQGYCYGNTMKEYITSGKQKLNNNVFLNVYENSNCHSNSFENNCCNNSFGDNCCSNSFGKGCTDNSFGDTCQSSSFGDYCWENSFGFECHSNSFGDICQSNSFGNECCYNSFVNGCHDNSFGHTCGNNSFGNDCHDNTFGDSCISNSFGNVCVYNTFENSIGNNTFGNSCQNNSFGSGCYYNSFGNCCQNNSFRVGAGSSSSLKNYVRYNHFDDGCSYNIIWNSDTTSNNVSLKNINVNRGVSGTSGSYNMINIDILNQDYEIQVAKNSKGEIKIYCEADLIA